MNPENKLFCLGKVDCITYLQQCARRGDGVRAVETLEDFDASPGPRSDCVVVEDTAFKDQWFGVGWGGAFVCHR